MLLMRVDWARACAAASAVVSSTAIARAAACFASTI